jgi:hypothetical protein
VEVLEASLKNCDRELGLVSFVPYVIFMDKQSRKEQILVVLRWTPHQKRLIVHIYINLDI